jgi:hypothetical protein
VSEFSFDEFSFGEFDSVKLKKGDFLIGGAGGGLFRSRKGKRGRIPAVRPRGRCSCWRVVAFRWLVGIVMMTVLVREMSWSGADISEGVNES